jgi:4-hydroxybenzoate polyprenyltransferase
MPHHTSRLRLYARLIRLDKPVGIYLLLWPTLLAFIVAINFLPNTHNKPLSLILTIFVLGVVLMRSAGCAINDWADRHIDGHVKRTQNRPLAAGLIKPREALWVAATLALMALCLLLLLVINQQQWSLLSWAFGGALLAGSYPFTKRFLAIPQAYLGIAFSLGIPMISVAVLDHIPTSLWWLWVANVFWTIAYDTEYAMVDKEDDLKLNIKTSAITFGAFDRLAVLTCHAISLLIWLYLGLQQHWGNAYLLTWVGALLLALYQIKLIWKRQPTDCFKAFLLSHWSGLLMTLGVAANLMLK